MEKQIISLLFLVLTIIASSSRKVHIGIAAFATAMLLGLIFGVSFSDVIAGFNVKLFVQIFAMQLMIAISRQNGTLDYVTSKLGFLYRGKLVRFFPLVMYVVLLCAELFGLNIYQLFLPVLATVALFLNRKPMSVMYIGILSMLAGCFSPYSIPGVILYENVTSNGIQIGRWTIPLLCMISYSVLFVLLYFYFGWHTAQAENQFEQKKIQARPEYIITIASYLAIVVFNLAFKIDISITACICAMLMCLFGFAEGDEVIKHIPYSVLMMFGGMSMLIGVVEKLGGIDLLTSMVSKVSNAVIAPAAITLLSGALSLFSSASGVVQPTLISTIPSLLKEIPQVSAQSLVVAIAVGSYAVAACPFDSGARILSAYCSIYQPDETDKIAFFNQLLKLTSVIFIYQSILSAIGFYSIPLG